MSSNNHAAWETGLGMGKEEYTHFIFNLVDALLHQNQKAVPQSRTILVLLN